MKMRVYGIDFHVGAGWVPNRICTLRSLVRGNFWGLSDHAMISAANFVTMVLVARGLGPEAFGAFTLVYTVLLLMNSLQSALITEPHNVLGASRSGATYARYTTSTAAMQGVVIVLAAGASAVAAVVAFTAGWDLAPVLLALVPAVAAWQAQEFIRRILYTEGRQAAVVANDVISYAGQAVVIAVLWRSDRLTGPSALYALAATSLLGTLVGLRQIRGSLAWPIGWMAFRENWVFGKWLGGGEIARWLSAEGYLYLSAAMLGAAAAGIIKAAQVLFGPVRILMFFLYTVLPIRFSRALAADGDGALRLQVRLAYAVVVPVLGVYSLLVGVFAEPILRLMYGAAYTNMAHVLVLYAAFAFVGHAGQLISTALKARRQSRPIFIGQMAATVLTIPVGWLLIHTLGVQGAVLSMIVTALIANVVFWRAFLHGSVPQTVPTVPVVVHDTGG